MPSAQGLNAIWLKREPVCFQILKEGEGGRFFDDNCNWIDVAFQNLKT
jgi:hypothetical protein